MRKNNANMLLIGMIWGLILWASPVFSWSVPDTGQTGCYDADGTSITCPESGQPFAGQDGSYLINPPSYTKLDDSGNELPDSATSWVMVRDNVTGLIWEVKTDDDTVHDKDNMYCWYDSNPETNGGNAGSACGGNNTEAFIDALNDANFGGYSDWRIPSRKELRSIVIYGWRNRAINTTYFPNTRTQLYQAYFSATTYAKDSSFAWVIDFGDGNDQWHTWDSYGSSKWAVGKDDGNFVRAVRGEQ